MITCVETLSCCIFPVHKKTLRLSAAWWVACLLLNMRTLGEQSGSCKAAEAGEGYVGGATYLHVYILLLRFPSPRWRQRGNLVMSDREKAVNKKQEIQLEDEI